MPDPNLEEFAESGLTQAELLSELSRAKLLLLMLAGSVCHQ